MSSLFNAKAMTSKSYPRVSKRAVYKERQRCADVRAGNIRQTHASGKVYTWAYRIREYKQKNRTEIFTEHAHTHNNTCNILVCGTEGDRR